jgi:hypothetical protein
MTQFDKLARGSFDKLARGAATSWTDAERQQAALSGIAMTDGSYPIRTGGDVARAVETHAYARDNEAAQTHITGRAVAVGATDLLPSKWPGSTRSADLAPVASRAEMARAAGNLGALAMIKVAHARPQSLLKLWS